MMVEKARVGPVRKAPKYRLDSSAVQMGVLLDLPTVYSIPEAAVQHWCSVRLSECDPNTVSRPGDSGAENR